MKIYTTALAVIAATVGAASAATVSVNFTNGAGNQQIAVATSAGIGGLTHWNNVSGKSGSSSSLTDSDGNASGITLTWTASTTWGDGDANTDANAGIGNAQLVRQYLDDGAPGVNIQASGMTGLYDVTIYLSTDGNNPMTFVPFTVNGVEYTTTGTYSGYGSGFTFGENNTIIVKGLSGNLTIQGSVRAGSNRGSVSGVQITAVPEPSSAALLGLGGLALILRRRK